MYNALTNKLASIFNTLRNKGKLSKYEIDIALKDVESALLDADVAIAVVKIISQSISEKALGQKIYKSVSPVDQVIKIVHEELVAILGADTASSKMNLNRYGTTNILMVGLQGSGKTTFSAKLANLYKKQGQNVLLVSLDTYRPAAREQLAILAESINVDSLEIIIDETPIEIAKRALKFAGTKYDIVIYDSAGRLHIDNELIKEIEDIKHILTPEEILLTIDALTGQDAINIAQNFHEALSLTGNLISKMDGDARGGAALSLRHVTSQPIKFLGIGERLDNIEIFDPKKMADKILDKGDIVSLVEKAKDIISEEEAERAKKRFEKGKFDLNDYLSHIQSMKKMGGIGSIMKMIPGAANFANKLQNSQFNDQLLKRQEAIICSMTKVERSNPSIINASRKKRICSGSGRSIQEINKLLIQFAKMLKMIKKTSKMDLASVMGAKLGNMF